MKLSFNSLRWFNSLRPARSLSGTAALLTSLLLGATPGLAQPTLQITHVNVVDVVTGTIQEDVSVVIANGTILELARSPATVRADSAVQVLEGRGKFLIPALWDMHVHLSYASENALPVLVATGVTFVRDLGSRLEEIDAWRGAIAAGALTGPTIVRAGPILNGEQFNPFQLAVTDAEQGRTTVRTLANVGVDFIKVHRRTPREAYFAILEQAQTSGLPVVGHIPITVSPLEATEAGQATIEHTETLFEGTFLQTLQSQQTQQTLAAQTGSDLAAAISTWREQEADALFQRFVANHTAFTPTLVVWREVMNTLSGAPQSPYQRYMAKSALELQEQTLAPLRPVAADFVRERERFLAEAMRVVAAAQANGVTLLAGTDLAAIPPGFSLHEELALLVQAGLNPLAALQTATLNPARLFPDLNAGQIEPGKRADLVLLSANPLADIHNTQLIDSVILRGQVLERATLDTLLEQAAAAASGF